MQTASRSPNCSWHGLASLRRRGQRPAEGVWVTDHYHARRNLEGSGGYALMLPGEGEEILLAGLEVIMLATRDERTTETAQRIAAAGPKTFAIYWHGEGVQGVV